ncbi:MAG: hypothetical protein ACOC2Y_02315 [Spirochaetota bacterium]
MYTLAVEIHGLKQLERLQPELTADIRRRIIAVVEVQGGSFADRRGGLLVFRFERAQPEDRQGVLDALSQTVALLGARENELAGWSVVLDYIEGSPAQAVERVHEALLPVYLDNEAWVGEGAHSLLEHHLELESERSRTGSLYRVVGAAGARGAEWGAVADYAGNERAVETILEKLGTEELVGGMLLVASDDTVALRANVAAALDSFGGAAAAARRLDAEAACSHPLGPVMSAFSPLEVHETGFWLNHAERGSWDERLSLVQAIASRSRSSILPDNFDADLLIAFECYLVSYVRRAAESLVPPILVCHNVDRWPPQALEAVARTVARIPVPEHDPGLIVVATSVRNTPPTALASLMRATVRLPKPTVSELRDRTAVDANWDRAMRVTSGRSAPVAHYLLRSEHWDSLTEDDLERVTDLDLAWRVVASEDSEMQELLLAAYYVAPFVTRGQYTEVAVRLGTDRVRVPAALARFRALGLIEDRDDIVPLIPELRTRLETALGRAARTVYEKVATTLVELVTAEAIVPTEELIAFLAPYREGGDLPRLYHRLLTRLLSERQLEKVQRLLYDAVPPPAYDPAARSCMQAVIATNRLRLALLQGNVQAAERTRTSSERTAESEQCDFAAGDLAVQKARLTFRDAPTKETIAILKQAVLVYQETDDHAGLARANLDFGLALLAQEDLLGAREYFLLASKSASVGTDLFERMRSRELSLVCEFVYGNMTRALAQADQLDAAAAESGMREVQLFAELARGRVLFELGRYDEAADVFSRGRSRARLYATTAPGIVMSRWVARSLIYDGRPRRGIRMLRDLSPSAETLFFLAEGQLRLGEHGEAIQALEEGLEMTPGAPGPVEGFSWTSGYASLEDRAIGAAAGTRVLQHQMLALRGYLLAESGRVADGVQEMHRLTRELRLSEIDPYNRIYFYLYSLILPGSGELNLEDGATVLGKAVRYIQQRTSRMDEYAHKTDYLRRNYWNARLMSHAQSHNLV